MAAAMDILPRQKPDPVPVINPVPEYAVSGQRRQWYDEMKSALQVPWMGVVTMAFAHFPNFFAELWRGLEPLASSQAFVTTALRQQKDVEAAGGALSPPAIVERLLNAGYGAREIEQIRAINAVFSHGNHAYALIATIARHLLEGGEFGGSGNAKPFEGRHAPDVNVPLVLMEAHHADAPTRAVYDDIKRVLGLPFVNTDYRAFARWPSYWAMAWGDLREVAGTPAHEALCQAYHQGLVASAREGLANPGNLKSARLVEAAEADGGRDQVLQVVRLFQWLLPGLAVNVAYLRKQLDAA
jgi:hypothetical protein